MNGSIRRKSGPRTTEDLLGSMWNAVRSNNGIMVRLQCSLISLLYCLSIDVVLGIDILLV